MATGSLPIRPPIEEEKDLGFGAVVARESRRRLLNRDGSFNVRRDGLSWQSSLSPYHWLLTMSWPRFIALIVVVYIATNALFGLGFMLCGPHALGGDTAFGKSGTFLHAFFFSVQTFATIGFGHVYPDSLSANLLVAFEALVGLIVFAIATGIVFSRFARPTANIIYSDTAVVSPYRGIHAFAFRITNGRTNQLIELRAKVIFSRFVGDGSRRDFTELELERRQVVFFPLSWTVVHPIDDKSPLKGLDARDLEESDAEFLVLLTATDETFSSIVHSRTSYKASEIVWNARFADIFIRDDDGTLGIDVGRLHETVSAPD